MCGLSGFVSKNGLGPSCLLAMNSSIKHRGPDDEGYVLFNTKESPKAMEFIGNDSPKDLFNTSKIENIENLIDELDNNNFNVALAHRRLSILDLSIGGHQPMKDSTGRFWIVFNGEIYNYKELRVELLKLGHDFHTESDTEVIINSYKEWGVDCLNKFNGMFAFVLHDSENSKFFIARDRLGIKPFYYSVQNGNFLFGSEIKAILAVPKILVQPNTKWLKDYLSYGPNEFDEFTSFSGILKLKSGYYIESNSEHLMNGLFIPKVWWNIDNLIDDKITQNEFEIELKTFNELFTDSVRLRTRSDVPIGCAFSGGLDSSAILSKMINFSQENGGFLKVETFSNVYKTVGTEYCDESEYIDSVILNLNVNNTKVEPTHDDLIKFYHEITYLQENPSMSTGISGYMTYRLMKNNGIVVSLDGQGADEQLGGYSGYYVNWLYNKSVKSILINLYKLNGFIEKKTLMNVIVGIALMKIIPNVILKKLSSFRSISYDLTPEGLNSRLLKDIKMNLSSLLHNGDRQSMGNSIEARFPFLDYRLVTYLINLKEDHKISNGWRKYILRKAVENNLPNDVVWRKGKKGWPAPEDFWFKGPLQKWSDELVEEGKAFLKKNGLKYPFKFKYTSTDKVKLMHVSMWSKHFFTENE